MKKLDGFIYNLRHLVLDEESVLATIKHIQEACTSIWSIIKQNMAVGNCGWADRKKWFIHFTCSNKEWEILRNEMNIIRVFGNMDVPENTNGNVYTTD